MPVSLLSEDARLTSPNDTGTDTDIGPVFELLMEVAWVWTGEGVEDGDGEGAELGTNGGRGALISRGGRTLAGPPGGINDGRGPMKAPGGGSGG